jgi:hypothetical protein
MAATTEFDSLSKKIGGFSFWTGPRHFVEMENEHHSDGLHFAWPATIEKVDMVIVLRLCQIMTVSNHDCFKS